MNFLYHRLAMLNSDSKVIKNSANSRAAVFAAQCGVNGILYAGDKRKAYPIITAVDTIRPLLIDEIAAQREDAIGGIKRQLKKKAPIYNSGLGDMLISAAINDSTIIDFISNNCIIIDDDNYNLYLAVRINNYAKIVIDSVTVESVGDVYALDHKDLEDIIYFDEYNAFTVDGISDNYYTMCGNGKIYHENEVIWIESRDEYYHEDECFRCDNCDEYHHIDDRIEDSYNELCRWCFENNYTFCSGCGNIEAVEHVGADGRCEYCSETRTNSSLIRNHSYKPDPIFFGNDTYFYGLELELKSDDNAALVEQLAKNDELYFKDDSSVYNGFEIVSHPCTYDHMRDLITRICSVTDYNIRAHNVGGIHIHISRGAFDSNNHLLNFYNFINDDANQTFIETVAQRELKQWTKKEEKKSSIKNSAVCGDRYVAVNLNNVHTIEIRIFNSNYRKERILKNIEFVESLIIFSRDDNCNLEDYLAYIKAKRNEYINLYNFLTERGVI